MTKKNSKNTGLARENAIFGKWMGLCAFLDRFVLAREDEFFRRIKAAVGTKIAEDDGGELSLSAFDVEIFDCYTNIMQVYRQVADRHLKSGTIITTLEIKGIWEGIYDLIMSRLMLCDNDLEINPIQAEKKEIAAMVATQVAGQMGEIVKEYRDWERRAGLLLDMRKVLLCHDIGFDDLEKNVFNITKGLQDFCEEPFYGVYRRGLETKLTNLNNLELRQQVSTYHNLLKEEIEILRQIIVVQAMALEKIAWDGGATPEETAFLDEVLGALRECYQQEGQVAGRINRAFLETAAHNKENLGKTPVDAETFEGFGEIYEEAAIFPDLAVIFEHFKAARKEKHTPFAEAVATTLNNRLGDFDKKLAVQRVYFAKKTAFQINQLAQECAGAFAEIVTFFEDGKEHFLAQDEKDIIKGVAETVSIKIDAIKDGAEQLGEEISAIIEGFPEEVPQAYGEGCGEEFVANRLLEGAFGAKFVKEVLDEFCTSQQEEARKAWAKREEPLDKKVLTFKRDNLFFELSTFEEIMHYSVSRLREACDVQILEFVVEIDKQHKNLEQILIRHGIEKIAPKAHETFNAKEHEVLMAEVQEGFKKGEIIKTMNSGYRQGERIITRANVIAAR
ncbi:MAG: nucleotide exchange factor GrpE [Defluviitaleaceae bacterium]|nr:nucleotide exchange factor GrpE [Defluviitaleaceae bacterium]